MLNRLFSSRRGRMAALFVIATALAAILLSAGRGDPYPHRPPRRRGNRHADPLL